MYTPETFYIKSADLSLRESAEIEQLVGTKLIMEHNGSSIGRSKSSQEKEFASSDSDSVSVLKHLRVSKRQQKRVSQTTDQCRTNNL